jgi:hypothetical protein
VNITELGSTPFREGTIRHASSWRIHDYEIEGRWFRDLWHYDTKMVEAVWSWNTDSWGVYSTNVGWGSRSDLQGVNKYLKGLGVSDALRLTSRKGRAFYYNPQLGSPLLTRKGK